jgi:stearoyl-CoA desaturase (delta-9 desaturase)
MFGGRYVLASLNASILSVVISGIVNWLGHYPIKGLTYTDYKMNNKSTNNPWAVFLTWGESLHNNHHANPRRLSFATRWYELDVGLWMINLIKKS